LLVQNSFAKAQILEEHKIKTVVVYINVNLDLAQGLNFLQTVVVYLEGCILSNALVAIGFEA
jgi:hypothetical protein